MFLSREYPAARTFNFTWPDRVEIEGKVYSFQDLTPDVQKRVAYAVDAAVGDVERHYNPDRTLGTGSIGRDG